MQSLARSEEFETGYLAGLIDGEGYICMHYDKTVGRSYPDLRIYCTSKAIVDAASRIMKVKPCPRRDHGRLVGWIGVASGAKALEAMRRIEPYLTDSSKKCRAVTCLTIFKNQVGIEGRHPSSEFFAHCPPPGKLSGDTQLSSEVIVQGRSRTRINRKEIPAETSPLSAGWLSGIVDGEGYVHVRYRGDRGTTYPRVRVFGKPKPIMDEVARVMGVNPYERKERGRHKGWYASVSHLKALRVLRLIAPSLSDPSKKARAKKIIDVFGETGTVRSRLDTTEFFSDCPPPCKPRKHRRVISRRKAARKSGVGKPGHPGGLIRIL